MGVVDPVVQSARPVSRAAAVAWRGYMGNVEDKRPTDFSDENTPSFDDAVSNTMGDRLEGFVLIEATEVAEGAETFAAELEEAGRALRTSIESLEAAYHEVRRVQSLEVILERPPRDFAERWAWAMQAAEWNHQGETLALLERATDAQRRAVPPEALAPALSSGDEAVRARALLLTAKIGKRPRSR